MGIGIYTYWVHDPIDGRAGWHLKPSHSKHFTINALFPVIGIFRKVARSFVVIK